MEKKGGVPKSPKQLQIFREAVDFCKFQDMGFEGYPFTWSNGREGDANIQLLLDRLLGQRSCI